MGIEDKHINKLETAENKKSNSTSKRSRESKEYKISNEKIKGLIQDNIANKEIFKSIPKTRSKRKYKDKKEKQRIDKLIDNFNSKN